jgi:hypothetical protein
MAIDLGRREFMALVGSALASRPIPVAAQGAGGAHTIGALIALADDAEARARIEAFERGLEEDAGPSVKTSWRLVRSARSHLRSFALSIALPGAIPGA